jgi:hypothetical protein
MIKKLAPAVACAVVLVAASAPTANAGTVCDTGNRVVQKHAGHLFETVTVHMGDEIPFVAQTACSATP